MYKDRPMTDEMADKYVHLIDRRGKALSQGKAVIEKFQSEYDKITTSLKDGFKPFLIWYISCGTNKLKLSAIEKTSAEAKEAGLFDAINARLDEGNSEAFLSECLKLQTIYLGYAEGKR